MLMIILLGIIILSFGCSKAEEEKVASSAPSAEISQATPTIKEGASPVIIVNSQFSPADLEIKVGDEVEWVNQDSVAHTVSFENGDVDEQLVPGATLVQKIDEKGEFRYFCRLHPGMQGSVVVN